jgi:hypothetical protein
MGWLSEESFAGTDVRDRSDQPLLLPLLFLSLIQSDDLTRVDRTFSFSVYLGHSAVCPQMATSIRLTEGSCGSRQKEKSIIL